MSIANSTNSSRRMGQEDSSASQPRKSGAGPTLREKSRKEHHWSRLILKSSGFVSRNSRKVFVCLDRSSMQMGSSASAVSRSRNFFVPSRLNSKQNLKNGRKSEFSRNAGSSVDQPALSVRDGDRDAC